MALVSSSQIFIASKAALPLAASPPVNPMPKPIWIGSAARAGPLDRPAKSSAPAISGMNIARWPKARDCGMAVPPPRNFPDCNPASIVIAR